jgi:hypothetical protein
MRILGRPGETATDGATKTRRREGETLPAGQTPAASGVAASGQEAA